MRRFITTSGIIAGLTKLDNIEEAIESTADRVKDIADTLEEIDNNLEVPEDDKSIYL